MEEGSPCDDLLEQVLDALTDHPGRILIWGISRATLRLLAEMRRLGLARYVKAVIDHREEQQGRNIGEWIVVSSAKNTTWDADYLVVGLDAEKEDILRRFAEQSTTYPKVIMYGTAHYDFRDPVFEELIRTNYVSSHAGGYPHMLVHIYQCLKYICARKITGDIAEFGVYKGGTTTFIAACLRRLDRPSTVLGFDTFEGFPPQTSTLDMHACPEDEYRNVQVVRANCQFYESIQLVVGDIAETYVQLQGRTLALSFFDTDNYSATRAALPLVAQITSPGGVIAFDHYYSPDWPSTIGERMAAQEVLCGTDWFNLHGTGIFLKVA